MPYFHFDQKMIPNQPSNQPSNQPFPLADRKRENSSDSHSQQQKLFVDLHEKHVVKLVGLLNMHSMGKIIHQDDISAQNIVGFRDNESDISPNSVRRVVSILTQCAEKAESNSTFSKALSLVLKDYAVALDDALKNAKAVAQASNDIWNQLSTRIDPLGSARSDHKDLCNNREEQRQKLEYESQAVRSNYDQKILISAQSTQPLVLATRKKQKLEYDGQPNKNRDVIAQRRSDNDIALTSKQEQPRKMEYENQGDKFKFTGRRQDPKVAALSLIENLNKATSEKKWKAVTDTAAELYHAGVHAVRSKNNDLAEQIGGLFRLPYTSLLSPNKDFVTGSMIKEIGRENLLDPNRTINYQEIVAYLRTNLRNIKCVDNPNDVSYSTQMEEKSFQDRTNKLFAMANKMNLGETICTPFNIDGCHWTLVTLTKVEPDKIHFLLVDSNATKLEDTLGEVKEGKTKIDFKLALSAWSQAAKKTKTQVKFGFVGAKVQSRVSYLNSGNGSDNHCGAWCSAVAEQIDKWSSNQSMDEIQQNILKFLKTTQVADIEAVRARMMADLLVPHP
jgi:hypothetical protein